MRSVLMMDTPAPVNAPAGADGGRGGAGNGLAPLAAQTPHERAHAPLPAADGRLVQDPDFTLPTVAGPLPWRLFYYSDQAQVAGAWGYGRRASWPTRLCAETSGGVTTVCLEREDGTGVHYVDAGSGFAPATPRTFDALARNADGSWDETRFDTGAVFHYPAGALASLAYYRTAQGEQVTLNYQGGLLQSLQEPAGRLLTYSYDGAGRVCNVTDWAQRVHTFAYLPSGEMGAMTGPAGDVTGYGYDPLHRLTAITDPNGFATTFTYDGQGRVLTRSVAGALGRYAYAGAATAYTDPLGGAWTTVADAAGNVVEITDPAGATRAAAFGPSGLPLSWRDALGRVTTMAYDANGCQTFLENPNGEAVARTFDGFGNLLTETDPVGRVVTCQYGASPQLRQRQSERNVYGAVTTYAYTPWGALQSAQTPLGHVTTYAWDGLGVMTAETDSLGGVRTYAHDAAGNLTAEMDATGRAWAYSYDAAGRRISTTDALGAVWTTTYDPLGNAAATTDPLGNRTSHRYNAYRRETARTDPRGHVWTTVYDAKGRPAAHVDPLGNATTLLYDAADRNTAAVDPLGNVTTVAYDLARQPVSRTDPLGSVTSCVFDPAGRLAASVDPLGNVTTVTYYADGQPAASVDPLGSVWGATYDAAGRWHSGSTPLGAVHTVVHDADGRPERYVDPLGNVTTVVYDAAGRPQATVDALGYPAQTVYDPAGRPLATVDALGNRTSVSYDAAGRPQATTDPNGFVTTTLYDAAGRPQAVQDPRGFVTTTVYDAADNVVALVDPNGHRTTTVYDARGLAAAEQDALGNWAYARYDAAGNAAGRTDARGWVSTFAYDALNRRQAALYQDGARETYAYDAAGRPQAVQDPTGATAYAYDGAGRVTQVALPAGQTLTYAYDADGARRSLTDPDGGLVTYAYDAARNLTGLLNPFGEATTLAYDPLHRERSRTLANGVALGRTYDPAGRPTALWALGPGGAPLAAYTATYDPAWQQTGVRELDGSAVTYAYDAAGQLVDEWRSGAGAYRNTYAYDPAGARLTKAAGGTVTAYSHDAANAITAVLAPGAAPVTQNYDANGNLTVQDAGGALTTYAWDARDRLTGVWRPDGTAATYAYGADGLRRTQAATVAGDGPAPDALRWGMQNPGIGHAIGRTDADGWSANTAQDPAGYLQYGPYMTQLAPGAHVAFWELLVDNNTLTGDPGPILHLDVNDADAPTGTSAVLASQDVSRSQWTAAGQYQTFALPFTLPASAAGHRIEMRVYWHGYAKVRERSLAVNVTGASALAVPDYGFEAVSIGAGNFEYRPSGSPWSFDGNAGISGNGSGFTSGTPDAPDAGQVAFVQSTGSLSQALTGFQSGFQYTLTVAAAQRGNDGVSAQSVEVRLDSQPVGAPITPAGTAYADYSVTFTTPAGGHTLSFVGLNPGGGDNTAFLDDVRIIGTRSDVVALAIPDFSFETPAVGSGNFQYAPAGSPWAFADGGGISGNGSGFTDGNPDAPEGGQVAFVQGTGTISQALSGFREGVQYTLTVAAARRLNYLANVVRVGLDGAALGTLAQPSDGSNGTTYQDYTVGPFTPAGGVHTLSFTGLDPNGVDCAMFLDELRLTGVPAPAPDWPAPALQINAGGAAAGAFAADADFAGDDNVGAVSAAVDTSGVTHPAPQAVYQTEHWGQFTYTLPGLTPGGAYAVRLHFAEVYFSSPGQRLFNVTINGAPVLRNFDIVGAAGGPNVAVACAFPATADAAGAITVALTDGAADNPKLSGLEVFPVVASGAGPAVATRFASDGQNLLLASGAGGAPTYYTQGPGAWGLLASHRDASGAAFYVPDLQGHTRLLTDAGGGPVATYAYSAYGERVLAAEGAGATPLGYGGQAGYYRDGDDGGDGGGGGDGRLYVRARHYGPADGAWLSRDPLGHRGGMNLYGYAANDPVNKIDPSGTDEKDAEERLFLYGKEITKVAKAAGIQPELLAGVVYVEAYAGGIVPGWNNTERWASITRFTFLGKGDPGITKFGRYAKKIPGLGPWWNIGGRFNYVYHYDTNVHQNLVDAAGFLRALASRPNRYPDHVNHLTPQEMSIVLSEYNQPPRNEPASQARPSPYGKHFLRGYSIIHSMMNGALGPVMSDEIKREHNYEGYEGLDNGEGP